MTRLGFFLFNILVVVIVYTLTYFGPSRVAAISFMLHNFSEPYIAVIIIMIVFTTIRWFMHHDSDVSRELGTWILGLLLVPAVTAVMIYLTGGLAGISGMNVHNLIPFR